MTLQAIIYQHLFIIILITLLFYGLVPLIGAFSVRTRWRQFRNQLMKASLRPSLTYGAVHDSTSSGFYRMFGSLQAVQDENILWLADSTVSVSIDLTGVPVYILPSVPKGESMIKSGKYPDESPRRTYWDRIFSLPEGTSIFVSGELIYKDGRSLFSNTKDNPLTIIIYDCDDSYFYSHAILSGRQRNEYWNTLTPGSLTIGSFSLFIYFYLLIQMPYMQFPAVTAIIFSLVPVIPFLPPGLAFYYIYRHLWKNARILRAERDLIRLPVNFFSGQGGLSHSSSVLLPDGARYQCSVINNLEEAWTMFADASLRDSSLLATYTDRDEYFVFGMEQGCISDPMAEILVVPGNPDVLLLESTKKAQKYEIFS
ncbi:MAG: hypothetical protein KAR21_22680, partial [Spirochaetales bacterium]|nr:hypothetical protein [Spirochaetales bacterium]